MAVDFLYNLHIFCLKSTPPISSGMSKPAKFDDTGGYTKSFKDQWKAIECHRTAPGSHPIVCHLSIEVSFPASIFCCDFEVHFTRGNI